MDEPPPKEALGERATLSIWEALALRGFDEQDIAGLQALQRAEGLYRYATWREAAEAGKLLLSQESTEQEEQELSPYVGEDPSGGRSLDADKMFASRIEPEEDEAVELLDEEEEIASATVELPDLTVEPQLYQEAQRQLDLQLAALNRLTALEWLSNLLLNRIKTTEQQIQEGFGTPSGRRLARKIDDLLLNNRQLALLLMDAIRRRLALVAAQVSKEGEHAKLLREIDLAAQEAAKNQEVYLAFRHLKGLQKLLLLSNAGVLGGIGRQHGEGDERSYRERYSSGIELLKQSNPSQYRENACLHNPDQCAGGPMEILWQLAERGEAERARDWYLAALEQYRKASFLVKSYSSSPPLTKSGKPDQERIDTANDDLLIAEDELEQAAAFYMEQVELHIGNYEVNSLLGKGWMDALDTQGAINRIDLILQRVLEIPFDQLAETPLNVVMEVAVSSPSSPVVSSSSSFPDVFSQSTAPKPTATSKRKQSKSAQEKRKNERITKAKGKLGPQQVTFEDLLFASQKKKRIAPPSDLVAQAETLTGKTFQRISGAGLNCYIRSLATWLANNGHIQSEHIEDAVTNLVQALADRNLRFEGEMIDAGGLAASEVQRLINQFAGVNVYITIVQWEYDQGQVVTFDANAGTNQVVLLYTPGHFDLLG